MQRSHLFFILLLFLTNTTLFAHPLPKSRAIPLRHGWQLTVNRSGDTFSLLRAARITGDKARGKKIRTPALSENHGSKTFVAQWTARDGSVVSSSVVKIPIGTRVFGDRTSGPRCETIVLPKQVVTIRVKGPRQYRGRKRPVTLMLRSISDRSLARFPVQHRSFDKMRAAPGPTTASKIRDTGSDSNRYTVAILGDGYTEANISSGKFDTDVTEVLSLFFTMEPWASLLDVTNIYKVTVVSNEEGADAPPEGIYRDTYLNTSYYTADIERLLAPDSIGYGRAVAAVDSYIGVGLWDTIMIVVNSERYGGAGGSYAVTALPFGSTVLTHEMGHAVGYLADEYGGDSSRGGRRPPLSDPNADSKFPPRWKHWIEAGTRLPTPATAANSSVIGAFEGASYYDYGYYRPKLACAMRANGDPFCEVCSEALYISYLDSLTLIETTSPSTSVSTDLTVGPATFSVTTPPFPDLDYEWSYCGNRIRFGNGSSVILQGTDGSGATCTLEATVRYGGSSVRLKDITETTSWTVQGCAAVDDCGVCGGDNSSCASTPDPHPRYSINLTKRRAGRRCTFNASVATNPDSVEFLTVNLEKSSKHGFTRKRSSTISGSAVSSFTKVPKGSYRAVIVGHGVTSKTLKCIPKS